MTSLDLPDRSLIEPHLVRITLAGGEALSAAHGDVCFPETLVASVGEVADGACRLDTGMIGFEGVIGWQALIGDVGCGQGGTALLGGGTALVLPARMLTAICEASETLRRALLRFVACYTAQLGCSVAAGLCDGMERRLARWLLMLHDRVAGDVLPVTHVQLAGALAVRRASVTDTLHMLEGDRIVRCTRGRTVIRDRAALRALAGSSYGAAEDRYARLIAPFGKS